MAEKIDFGSGLELILVKSIDFRKDSSVMDVVRAGVELQLYVFREQGVSQPEKRVLSYDQSVGSPEDPGALNEGRAYSHLYVLRQGKLIGMMASEEYKISGVKGIAVLDYFLPLVPTSESFTKYHVRAPALGVSGDSQLITPITLPEIMARTTLQFTSPERVAARFNDGIGVSRSFLAREHYLECEVKVPVPPLDAETEEEYKSVLDEVCIYGKFSGAIKPRLTKEGANQLLKSRYLKDGYVEEGRRGFVSGLGLLVKELPCVKELDSRINSAIAEHNYVVFLPFEA